MQILATYDGHETGVSEDNIDGGFVVNNAWFKIAHPMALKHLLGTIAWMPEEFGAARENHIVRSTAVVNSVIYRRGSVQYSTFDAPPGTTDVLRLAFVPKRVTADGQPLEALDDPWPETAYIGDRARRRRLPGHDSTRRRQEDRRGRRRSAAADG